MGEGRNLSVGRLAALAGLDMAEWWQATAESYFARVPKVRILDAVAEAVSPAEAAKLSGLKKAELAEAAQALLKDRRWLPVVLRSSAADSEPFWSPSIEIDSHPAARAEPAARIRARCRFPRYRYPAAEGRSVRLKSSPLNRRGSPVVFANA